MRCCFGIYSRSVDYKFFAWSAIFPSNTRIPLYIECDTRKSQCFFEIDADSISSNCEHSTPFYKYGCLTHNASRVSNVICQFIRTYELDSQVLYRFIMN